MILDDLLKLAAAQNITAAGGVTSTNTIDLDDPTIRRRVGTGEGLSVIWVVTTAAVVSTNTISFLILQSVNADLSSPTTIAQRLVLGASLTLGTVVQLEIPKGTPTARYLGSRVTTGAGDTVSVSSYVVPTDHVPEFTAYSKSYTV
jgi:hypothetical protein